MMEMPDGVKVAKLDVKTGAKVPNPHFVRRKANRCLLSQVRVRMIFRYQKRKDERGGVAAPDGDEDGGARSDDDDGEDPDRPAVSDGSDGSADEDPADAAARLREELEMVRDARPTADGVDELEPAAGEWQRASLEQRLSAAHSAPAAGDVQMRPGSSGDAPGGVSVNPRGYAWASLEGTVGRRGARRAGP